MRIFLGINLGLRFNDFSLGNHIPNCKGILGGVGISFILPLLLLLCFLFCLRCHHCPILLFFSPYWYFSILRRFLCWERLFRRRKRKGGWRRRSYRVLSELLWIIHLVHPPQIGICRDSCPIKGLIIRLRAVFPPDHGHFSS